MLGVFIVFKVDDYRVWRKPLIDTNACHMIGSQDWRFDESALLLDCHGLDFTPLQRGGVFGIVTSKVGVGCFR